MTKRQLTNGEIKLAQSLFGNSIDYSAVTVTDSKYIFFQPKGTGMAPDGHLYMFGCYNEDYSKGSPLNQSFFIHEMTHVWQHQNKILDPKTEAINLTLKHKFNYNNAYKYTLSKGKDLTSYGMEEQATIVQDYFLNQYEGYSCYTRFCQNRCSHEEKMDLYKSVLANFLTNPSYASRNSPPKSGKPPKPNL